MIPIEKIEELLDYVESDLINGVQMNTADWEDACRTVRKWLESQRGLTTHEADKPHTCPSCATGLCPDGKGGFIPCTICGREPEQV